MNNGCAFHKHQKSRAWNAGDCRPARPGTDEAVRCAAAYDTELHVFAVAPCHAELPYGAALNMLP